MDICMQDVNADGLTVLPPEIDQIAEDAVENEEIEQPVASNIGCHADGDAAAAISNGVEMQTATGALNSKKSAAMATNGAADSIRGEMGELLEKCSPEQADYILNYASSMEVDGYSHEFSVAVAKAMAILYAEKIDDLIPQSIVADEPTERDAESEEDETIFTRKIDTPVESQRDAAKEAIVRLAAIMEDNGADYGIISKFLGSEVSSSNDEGYALAMQHFFLMQKKDQSPNAYYWASGHEKAKQSYDNLIANGPDAGKFAKTIAMYKAFTGVALNAVNTTGSAAGGISHERNSCTLRRGITRLHLVQYEGYGDIGEGETFSGLKHGILASTSLGTPTDEFTETWMDVIEIEVPFHNIFVAYFLTGNVSNGAVEYSGLEEAEREFICDSCPSTVKLVARATDENAAIGDVRQYLEMACEKIDALGGDSSRYKPADLDSLTFNQLCNLTAEAEALVKSLEKSTGRVLLPSNDDYDAEDGN